MLAHALVAIRIQTHELSSYRNVPLAFCVQLYSTLKRGMMGCKRRRGCAWVVCLSPMEHVRLEDAYRRSHQVTRRACKVLHSFYVVAVALAR